ncbi:MAG: hypothetical protein Q8N89_17615 [Azonexus sp.]|nr:hypothetical protein [Azonexus sp.]
MNGLAVLQKNNTQIPSIRLGYLPSATYPAIGLNPLVLGRPALSLLLAGMSLLRRRFAPAIPPRRASGHVALSAKG